MSLTKGVIVQNQCRGQLEHAKVTISPSLNLILRTQIYDISALELA